MKTRSVLHSPRLDQMKKKKGRALKLKALLFLFLFIAIIVGLAFGARNQKVNINTVEISGNKVIDQASILALINEKLAGNYLWLFPKTNFLWYPKKEIKNELSNKFKRLKDISIYTKNIQTLEVSVSEREAKYTWCGASPMEVDGKCYFLDENGYIFDEAPYFSGDVYFKFYGLAQRPMAEGSSDPANPYFFADIFKQLALFKDSAEKMDLKPKAFYISPDGDIKIFLSSNNKISDSPAIIFRKDADFNKVSENLQAALSTEPLQSNFKNKYSSLLYIDLRFDNKVYFKFK